MVEDRLEWSGGERRGGEALWVGGGLDGTGRWDYETTHLITLGEKRSLGGGRFNEGVMANQGNPRTWVVIITTIIHPTCPCPIDWHGCFMAVSKKALSLPPFFLLFFPSFPSDSMTNDKKTNQRHSNQFEASANAPSPAEAVKNDCWCGKEGEKKKLRVSYVEWFRQDCIGFFTVVIQLTSQEYEAEQKLFSIISRNQQFN